MRTLGFGTLLGAVLATASAARAENHFLLELEGGLNSPVGVEAEADDGYGGALTFGIGGRFRHSTPALYLVGRAGYGEVGSVGPARTGGASLDREQREYAFGGRIYLPITERLRVMLQVAAGQIFEDAIVRRDGHPEVRLEDDRFAVFGDAGLQLRLSNQLSVGGNVGLAWQPEDEGPDLASLAAGIPDPDGEHGRVRLGVAATFHF
jgi:hypothetical protein